jgi:hypothetical protein
MSRFKIARVSEVIFFFEAWAYLFFRDCKDIALYQSSVAGAHLWRANLDETTADYRSLCYGKAFSRAAGKNLFSVNDAQGIFLSTL